MIPPSAFRSRVRPSVALATAFTLLAAQLSAQSTFRGPVSGQQWGTAANWTAGVPNAVNAVAVLASNGGLGNIAVTNSGLGYVVGPAPTVTLTGGLGSGAVAQAVLSSRVSVFTVTDGGSGYTSAPEVVLTGGSFEVPATAISTIDPLTGKVTSVTVTFGGSGYVTAPFVTLVGGGGSGAEATAHLAVGVVGFNLSNFGTYSSTPTVSIQPPVVFGATTAVATTSLVGDGVGAVSLHDSGAGYVVPPVVVFGLPPPGGTRAQGYAVLSGDEVDSVVLTHAGSGYLSPPSVTFGAPVVTATASASLGPLPYLDSVGGTYPYTVGTINMTFNASTSIGRVETSEDRLNLEQSGGTQAVATATVDNGVITGISLSNQGNGYEVAPLIYAIGGGGRGARLAATVSEGRVTLVTVLSGGTGYTTQPTIVIQPPDSPVFNIAGSSATLFFYGKVEGDQGFTKAGAGALTFRFNPHANAFKGNVYLAQGVLGIQHDGSLGDPQNDLFLGDLTRLVAQPSVANAPVTLNANRTLTLAGGGAQFSAQAGGFGFFTVEGPITGPGGVVKVDSGTLVLTGSNTYTGETNVNAGVFVAEKPASLPGYREPVDSSNQLPERISIAAGATLAVRMGAPGRWDGQQFDALLDNFDTRVHPNAFIGVDTTGAVEVPFVDGLITNQVLAPTWGFAKLGEGILDLTGNNAYQGNTRLYQGTLRLSAGGVLPLNNTVQFMNSGAILDLGGTDKQIGSLIEFSGGTSTVTNGDLIVGLPDLVLGGNNNTVVDFSGLNSFTYEPVSGDFRLETINNATRTSNTVRFSAQQNTLRTVLDQGIILGGGTAVAAGPHTATALFGAENTVRTDRLQVGLLNTGGTIAFLPGLTNPEFNLRSSNGGRAAVIVGETSSSIRSANGLLNFTGGSVDASISKLTVGRMSYETALSADSGPPAFGMVAVEAGVMDASTMVLGEKVNQGQPYIEATFLQYGGEVEAGTITFGESVDGTTNGGSALFESTYWLGGGVLKVSRLETGDGASDSQSLRTLVLAGGTLTTRSPASNLTVNGRSGAGNSIEIAVETGTTSIVDVPLDRSVTFGANTQLTAVDSSAVLTKAGEGRLQLLGGNAGFEGTLQHTLGTLALGLDAGIATLTAGSFTWDAGTLEVDLSTSDTTSDKLVLTGALSKGGVGPRVVDLKGVGALGTYVLATYASTNLLPADLSAINIPNSWYATFIVKPTQLELVLSETPLLSLIEQWRFSQFGNSENIGQGADDADPDSDGRKNLLEYALGTDPLSGGVSGVTLDLSGGALRLTFTRTADPTLVYRVVATNSLAAPWSAGTEIFQSTGAANTAGVVQVVDTVPATSNRFLRLEVTIAGSVPPLSPLEQWRLAKFGDSTNSGNGADSADPDFDGRTNLLEYAVGGEPLVSDAGGVVIDLSGGVLRLTFNRIADPSLIYRVVVSTNLGGSWSSGTELFTSTGVANVAGPVQVLDTAPASSNRFLRLEVSY